MIARTKTATITTVITGGRVTGFLLSRGPQGVEAFDASERSIGVFPDARAGHAAVIAETGRQHDRHHPDSAEHIRGHGRRRHRHRHGRAQPEQLRGHRSQRADGRHVQDHGRRGVGDPGLDVNPWRRGDAPTIKRARIINQASAGRAKKCLGFETEAVSKVKSMRRVNDPQPAVNGHKRNFFRKHGLAVLSNRRAVR